MQIQIIIMRLITIYTCIDCYRLLSMWKLKSNNSSKRKKRRYSKHVKLRNFHKSIRRPARDILCNEVFKCIFFLNTLRIKPFRWLSHFELFEHFYVHRIFVVFFFNLLRIYFCPLDTKHWIDEFEIDRKSRFNLIFVFNFWKKSNWYHQKYMAWIFYAMSCRAVKFFYDILCWSEEIQWHWMDWQHGLAWVKAHFSIGQWRHSTASAIPIG